MNEGAKGRRSGPVASVPTLNNKQDSTRTSLAPAPISPRNSAKSLSDLHFRATNWINCRVNIWTLQ